MTLPDDLVERARAHADGQRLVLPRGLGSRVIEEAVGLFCHAARLFVRYDTVCRTAPGHAAGRAPAGRRGTSRSVLTPGFDGFHAPDAIYSLTVDVTRCAPDDLAGHEDAMVRAFVPAATRAWRGGRAVALMTLDSELRVPMLLGIGAGAAAVVTYAARDGGATGMITVPYEALPVLPDWLRPAEADAWAWRAIEAPPPVRPGEERVAWLGEDDLRDVKGLLAEANPGTSVWPGDGAARRWAGIRDGGRLCACLADTTRFPGIGHVSGIATAPDARGRGYGAAVTAWAARKLFAEGAGLVTLGVYSDNAAAMRMYDRLRFSDEHRMGSGVPPDRG